MVIDLLNFENFCDYPCGWLYGGCMGACGRLGVVALASRMCLIEESDAVLYPQVGVARATTW